MGRNSRWATAILVAAVALHLVMLASLYTRWLNPLFNDTYNRPGPAADFFAVYHSGRQVLIGQSPYLHADESGVTPPYFAPYRYTPGVAYTLGVAFAWLEPWWAYVAWLVLIELLLLFNLWLLRFMLPNRDDRMVAAAAWIAFPTLYVELWMGQFTFATASLVFAAVVAWHRQRARTAAALWSIACAAKLFPLALGAWLLRHKRWRTLATCSAVMALALVWFIGRPDDWELFYRLNFAQVDFDFGLYHAGNFGLHALLYELVAPASDSSWRLLTSAVSLVMMAAAATVMLRRDTDVRIAAALALLLLPLVSRHVWEHHYVVVLPAFTLLVWANRGWLVPVAITYAVLWLPSPLILMQQGPPAWHPEYEWSRAARVLYHCVKAVPVLVLFLYVVGLTMRGKNPPAKR